MEPPENNGEDRGFHKDGEVNENLFPSVPGTRSYSTLQNEALKVFSSLQHLEGVADPVPIIQGMLQMGQELRPLRDELYCQLIKQTTRPPQPGSGSNLCVWKILACMSCTFIPTRSILRYLKFHLKRYGRRHDDTRATRRVVIVFSSVLAGLESCGSVQRRIITPPSPSSL